MKLSEWAKNKELTIKPPGSGIKKASCLSRLTRPQPGQYWLRSAKKRKEGRRSAKNQVKKAMEAIENAGE